MSIGVLPCKGDKHTEEVSKMMEPPAASAGYSDWQLFTVKRMDSVDGTEGALPVICLPKSLIGKTVKVTIEEQP